MGTFIPPYTISEKMLEQVSAISEKVGKITGHRELESKPHLRRNNRIRSIHSSLKIEANSLSLNEVRDVINGHLVIGDQKEIQEVKNAYAAYEKISEIDPSSAKQLKEIHGIMTHLIHSFCCSERASHTSGRTITVKTAGCFLLAEKYYSIDAGKILFSEYSRNIRKIYCYSAFRTWTLQRLCSEGDNRQRGQ